MPELDGHLAAQMAGLPGGAATELAKHLVRQCCLGPSPLLAPSELHATLDTLSRLAARAPPLPGGTEIQQLVEQARATARCETSPLGHPPAHWLVEVLL